MGLITRRRPTVCIAVAAVLFCLTARAAVTDRSLLAGRDDDEEQSTAAPETRPALTLPSAPVTGQGDPLADKAWHLAAMGLPGIWKRVTKGNPAVTIAFVDSGIDYTHPDLAPNLRWNMTEWPMNGKDKDHNGFIDDVIGFDFVNSQPLPWDTAGHGTFLAGLAVAVEGNGVGSAGVCPKCTVLPVRFIDGDGYGDTDDAIKAIRYATMMNVSVINVSFSGEGYDQDLHDALAATLAKDIVVVAAASNDGLDLDKEEIYPAKFDLPNLVTVAAVDSKDKLWDGSNWGKKTVHFGAPGVDLLSIWKDTPGGYDVGSGTSDAAAIASGAIGLLRSAEPQLSAPQVVQLLLKTARHVPALEGKTKSGGVIDIPAAIRCADRDGCLDGRDRVSVRVSDGIGKS